MLEGTFISRLMIFMFALGSILLSSCGLLGPSSSNERTEVGRNGVDGGGNSAEGSYFAGGESENPDKQEPGVVPCKDDTDYIGAEAQSELTKRGGSGCTEGGFPWGNQENVSFIADKLVFALQEGNLEKRLVLSRNDVNLVNRQLFMLLVGQQYQFKYILPAATINFKPMPNASISSNRQAWYDTQIAQALLPDIRGRIVSTVTSGVCTANALRSFACLKPRARLTSFIHYRISKRGKTESFVKSFGDVRVQRPGLLRVGRNRLPIGQ